MGIVSALPFASAQSSDVPDWVKNNAKWWSEGKISEKEYLDAIKFLVENKIINVGTLSTQLKLEEEEKIFPSTKQTQVLEKFIANKPPISSTDLSSDDTFLSAMQVKIGGGDFTETLSLDTFARYNVGKDNTFLAELREAEHATYFVLESLPSKDKADFYNLLSKYINPGKEPLPFDVRISGIMNDGTTLLTIFNKKCQVHEYSIYTQDLSITYQYTNEKQGEIRDKILFLCGGTAIGEISNTFPEIEFTSEESIETNSPKATTDATHVIPDENDRAMSYVVHFWDGEIPDLRSFATFKIFSPKKSFRS